jgi:hypothetical protein
MSRVARPGRRLRGALLRTVLDRRMAVVAGLLLLAPAIVIWTGDYAWESWMTDGLALVCSATGAALLVAGLSGRRPDWID